MSSTTDAVADVVTGRDREAKRDILNPWGDSSATLLDAANELCRGYMRGEKDAYLRLGKHHAAWLDLLDHERKLVLNCHRDGLKTTVVLAYLICRLEYDPGFRAIWGMNNQDIAIEKAHTEFNRMVDRNPWLTSLNASRRRDTVKKKEFENGSTLRATWLDSGIDGDRAHLLVLDDLIKARGDGDPESIHEWIEGTAVPMVKDGGRQVIVGTRKRPDDIYVHYRGMDAYTVAEYPAVLDVWEREHATDDTLDDRRPPEAHYSEVSNPWRGGETIRVLWPDARGPGWLAEKRDEMADHRFWREYCLALVGASGDLIAEAPINRLVDDGGCSIREESPPRTYTAARGEQVVTGFDPAQSPTGDQAAFYTQLVRADGTRVLLDCEAARGLQPSEIKTRLAEINRRYDPSQIVIEDNGMQQYVVNDALEFDPAMRSKVVGRSMSGGKHSWENGIPRLQTLVENGDLHLYRDDPGTEDFITAALSLRLSDGTLDGHTPDLIAAWYMAEKAVQHSGGGFSPSDHDISSIF